MNIKRSTNITTGTNNNNISLSAALETNLITWHLLKLAWVAWKGFESWIMASGGDCKAFDWNLIKQILKIIGGILKFSIFG